MSCKRDVVKSVELTDGVRMKALVNISRYKPVIGDTVRVLFRYGHDELITVRILGPWRHDGEVFNTVYFRENRYGDIVKYKNEIEKGVLVETSSRRYD